MILSWESIRGLVPLVGLSVCNAFVKIAEVRLIVVSEWGRCEKQGMTRKEWREGRSEQEEGAKRRRKDPFLSVCQWRNRKKNYWKKTQTSSTTRSCFPPALFRPIPTLLFSLFSTALAHPRPDSFHHHQVLIFFGYADSHLYWYSYFAKVYHSLLDTSSHL